MNINIYVDIPIKSNLILTNKAKPESNGKKSKLT